MLVEVFLGLVEQTLLHCVEQLGNLFRKFRERNGDLLAVIAPYGHTHAVFNIARADLNAQRNALHLILCALPAEAVVTEVYLDADARRPESGVQLVGLLGDTRLVLRNGDDDDLHGRDARRQDQTVIVAVGHDDTADDAGGQTPGGLVRMLLPVLAVGEGDVELLGKAGAEVMARAGLERLVVVHHALDGVGVYGAGELFLLGLVAADDWHGKVIFTQVGVDLKLMQRLLACLGLGLVQSMPLLPEELSAAQEGTRCLFPAEYGAPLIVQHRKISP